MDYAGIEDVFVQIGGQFYTSAYKIQTRLKDIKAYVFDWDGVFNSARKGADQLSDYSEVDSMGIKMLRFAHFLMHKNMAYVAIFDEKEGSQGKGFAKRDSFDEAYTNLKDKRKALSHFCEKHNISPDNVVYVYDDVMDVGVAAEVSVRLAVGRDDSPVFREFLKTHKLADYRSGSTGGKHAVREHCELLLMLLNKHHEVIERMSTCDPACLDFEEQLEQKTTEIYSYDGQKFSLGI